MRRLLAGHITVVSLMGVGTLVPSLVLGQDQAVGSAAFPQPVASSLPARLSDVEGSVHIGQMSASPGGTDATRQTAPGQVPPPPADQAFSQATLNMPVLAGTEIATGDDGRAELQFNDGGIARLTPNSILHITSLGNGAEQLRGLSYFETPDRGTGVITVQAGPDGVRLAQGSLLRFDLDSAPYAIAVLRGSAHFNNQASDIGFEANTGETATIDPQSATAYDLTQDMAQNSWDAWNTDRDSTLAQLADGETNARVGSGDTDSPAWNDLDYYGTWYNVPGAGMAWAPDGVDANFDPYGSGAWGYYSGVGATWVSSYPWGWLPYHCGGWSYFGGFGWGWQPGGCGSYGGAGWYPYTGVHHPPPGYRLPARPLDPRLRTHLGGVPLPHSQPLKPVVRGPIYRFRQVGGTRPEPRAFPLDKTASVDGGPGFAPILPLGNTQGYGQQPGSAFNGSTYGSSYGNNGAGLPARRIGPGVEPGIGRGRAIITPGPNVITPPSRMLPPPRMAVPPPVRVAPPPAAAPRFSAPPPASVPAPRAH